ncbi:MAG: serine/threonine-protein kinase HipA [Lentisphaeria bacterium]|jgi:serine/threonine-protein kinase HipA
MPSNVKVSAWGMDVGVVSFDGGRAASFQYFPHFIGTGIELSPLHMPLGAQVYRFPENLSNDGVYVDTFCGLPGLIADSLPEKFGNRLLGTWLAKQGRDFADLSIAERLCYLGERGMGALEFHPAQPGPAIEGVELDVSELMDVAQRVLSRASDDEIPDQDLALEKLISVGASAGGAKAKAVIAWNEQTQSIMSGQGELKSGYTHWLLKFDEIPNEEHADASQIGRIEYVYHQMAVDCGISMMPCQLLEDGERAHFMTQRFDRTEATQTLASRKLHVQTYCGIAHADRNPPGQYGYEHLFKTARQLGLGQDDLDELFRRMVFNIVARNQDDHSKNHGFLLDDIEPRWMLSPAYDLCFSYKPGNPFISSHQMSCSGKRDGFAVQDLIDCARTADIKSVKAKKIIDDVLGVTRYFSAYANECGLREDISSSIKNSFRFCLGK